MQAPTVLSLNLMRPGAEIGIDSRRSHNDENIEGLALSITKKGLLQPLGVWLNPEDDNWYVAFGNRRLKALQLLAEQDQIDAAEQIPVKALAYATRAEVLEASMAENLERQQLHPVDEFEDFAALVDAGWSAEEVAQRQGLSLRLVNQRLALGRLAPEVRAAWRDRGMPIEVAQAFTLEPDLKRQADILAIVTERFGDDDDLADLYPHYVRQEIIGGSGSRTAKWLIYVGQEAYQDAGGRIITDLFNEKAEVLDVDLLAELARDKLTIEAQKLAAEGWGNVITEFDMADSWYSYERVGAVEPTEEEAALLEDYDNNSAGDGWGKATRLREEIRLRNITDEEKAASFSMVTIDHEGNLRLDLGKAPKGTQAKPAATSTAPEGQSLTTDGPTEPGRVVDSLRLALTHGLGQAISTQHDAALRLFVATALAGAHCGSPICVLINGGPGMGEWLDVLRERHGIQTFEDAIAHVDALERKALGEVFAAIVVASLDANTSARNSAEGWGKSVTADGVRLVMESLDGPTLEQALREKFDPVAYFDGAKKDHALTAIDQAWGPAVVKLWTSKKKSEVADWAIKNVPGRGWLPFDLRFPGYAHPFNPLAEPSTPEDAGLVQVDSEAAVQALDAGATPAEAVVEGVKATRRKGKAKAKGGAGGSDAAS